MKPWLKENGSLLLTTVIILAFISMLGLSMIVFLLSQATTASLELDRLKALYMAEAGIARSVYELKKDEDPDGNGIGNVVKMAFAGGTLKASHNFQASTITATGECNNIKRTIQIKYSAL